MGVGQLSESDAVDALRLPFYSSSHPTGSHGWGNQFDLGNPRLEGLSPRGRGNRSSGSLVLDLASLSEPELDLALLSEPGWVLP